MNIVVTGATSFIGIPLIRLLLEHGHTVFAIVRPGSKNAGKLDTFRDHQALHIVYSELGGFERIREAVKVTCDACYHLGWDGSGSANRTLRKVQQRNAMHSMEVLKGAALLGCKKFIFSGSQAEYGIHKEAMTEDTPLEPVSEYGRAKVDFCRMAREWLCTQDKRDRMDFIHSRIFSIYGPGDHPWSLVESCLDAFLRDEAISLGECTQLWNFLYIDDLVAALFALLDLNCGIEGVCCVNIAGDEPATRPLRDYVEELYRLCGSKGSFHYGSRLHNAEGPANLIPDIRRIKAMTGWEPKISFEDGIIRMLKIRTENIK